MIIFMHIYYIYSIAYYAFWSRGPLDELDEPVTVEGITFSVDKWNIMASTLSVISFHFDPGSCQVT